MRKVYERSSSALIWLRNDDTAIVEECLSLLIETARISRALLKKYNHPDNIPNPMVENPICADPEKWDLDRELVNLSWLT
ncbi:hypothetical protein OCU04_005937 [Sclerotinia nivalis]|uniref:Uncharacterized protein n=1 Tax=Sclerotinia nivalis TaxID=352851 RepID=A0A9X0ALY4_9HELO|nr:hypothetical protein OCU04_005937 [Sclerotinia nivalis]